jgi:hypothetical protein
MSTIDIVVLRGSGDKQGDDIVSGLLSNLQVAQFRGAVAINDAAPHYDVSLRTYYRPGVRTGQYIAVMDASQGRTWFGKIVSLNHVLERPAYYTDMKVRRFSHVEDS